MFIWDKISMKFKKLGTSYATKMFENSENGKNSGHFYGQIRGMEKEENYAKMQIINEKMNLKLKMNFIQFGGII